MELRDKILALTGKLKREKIYVKEWDSEILIQELTALQRERCMNQMHQYDMSEGTMEVNFIGSSALLVAMSVIHEDGTRVFKDEDIPKLGGLPVVGLEKVSTAAQKLSNMESNRKGKKSDLKNSEEGHDEDS